MISLMAAAIHWAVNSLRLESGKHNDRQQLSAALHLSRVTGTIAKLDRLSRDVHFLVGLEKARVPFIATDMPEANEMVVGILAIVAQGERKMISDRTTAALAAANRRGARLGNPRGAKHLRKLRNDPAIAAVRANAASRADSLLPVIEEIRGAGITSAAAIADELNRRGILTPRDARWHPTSARRLLERLG
jgi:DNA invertase Pin-like site-specific DNA recombinase